MGRDDLTCKVIKDGWYVTGDVARIDTDGFIHITLGRYLHAHPTLWYQDPLLGFAPLIAPHDRSTASALSLDASRYFLLDETRRMRSGELHYFDHPKFGVLIQIDPVAIPAPLIAQYQALGETASLDATSAEP